MSLLLNALLVLIAAGLLACAGVAVLITVGFLASPGWRYTP